MQLTGSVFFHCIFSSTFSIDGAVFGLCCRVAVFCCLGLGSIFGRFGGVFVRFLVVLGGLRGVLGALLGSWSPLTSTAGLVSI